jgi:hypothetical protein
LGHRQKPTLEARDTVKVEKGSKFINVLELGAELINLKYHHKPGNDGQVINGEISSPTMIEVLSKYRGPDDIDIHATLQAYLSEKIRKGVYRKCQCDACTSHRIPMLVRDDIDLITNADPRLIF